ncbi:MAG: DUF4349 domain-containing protein [Oscillospiraceae bacterium]|nr:DUF4349 domain-containing protein [Oscillospiraceae bacterium]
MKKRDQKHFLAILLTLLLLLGLTACGGSQGVAYNESTTSSAPAAANGYAADAETAEYWADSPMETPANAMNAEDGRGNLPDGVKMIYRANLELVTQEYEKATADIVALTNSLGGYFEEQSSYHYNANYRSASYTVRVPAARFEEFLRQAGELFSIRSQSQSADDVSERYYDMESRLETAQIKLDRLQALLAKAENMEDIITIESAISETEYQIENLSGELRHYDALIDYATIYVSLQETYQPTEQQTAPLTFGDRMARAFRNGLRDFRYAVEDFALWLAEAWLPLLVIVALVVLAVRFLRRKKTGGKLRGKGKNAPADTTEKTDQQ